MGKRLCLCLIVLGMACESHDQLLGPQSDAASPPDSRSTAASHTPDAWRSLTPTLIPVRAAAIASTGKFVFILGGNAGDANPTTLNQIYDVSSDTWALGAPFSGARDFAMAAEVRGEIHLFGGASPGILSDHQVYDPRSDSWSQKAALPIAVDAAGVAVVHGKVYVIGGGIGGPNYTSAVQIYDPRTDSWTQGAPMPTPRLSATTVVMRGMIHVIGGQTTAITTTDAHEVYDPKRDVWRDLHPLPAPREAAGGGAFPQTLCVFGGRLAAASPTGDAFPETFCYDWKRDEWAQAADMLTPRAEIASVELRGQVLAIGGRTATAFASAAVEALSR